MPVEVRGHLRLTLIPGDTVMSDSEIRRYGRVVFSEHNLIVDVGMQVFSRMLGGNAGSPTINGSVFSSIEDLAVTRIQLGKSTSPPPPAFSDVAPGVADPVLYEPPLIVTYPTATSVNFAGLVPSTEQEGVTFTEEAVYLRNGLLFAKRLISPGVLKVAGLALQVDHSFTFARA